MVRLTINKNKQASITIPKEVIKATGWKNGDILYVGKNKGENSAFIEKVEKPKEEKNKK